MVGANRAMDLELLGEPRPARADAGKPSYQSWSASPASIMVVIPSRTPQPENLSGEAGDRKSLDELTPAVAIGYPPPLPPPRVF